MPDMRTTPVKRTLAAGQPSFGTWLSLGDLFATRISAGRHTFSYLVRATTAGTFRAAGATAEQMYAPEVKGRAEPATVEVR